ncbi:uncharacterized protein LOC114524960 [Dendronephthya gigantea]|uniref:uncharacterized protein LOC114524960 n=1 Tax=Dendronephthya gigantea TaxID=151771 RepID=UPI0010698180|nr:uncharacterized protein LOC114524960 [Dendronephthya gigantea]
MSSAFQQANGFKLALGLSKLFEREFNQPDLHDRVLVFDVVASKKHKLSTSNVIGNKSSENDVVFQNSAGEDQREPGNQSGKVDNTSDENETGVHGCKILPMYANGNRGKELNNLGDQHFGSCPTDEDKSARETAVANEHEITLSENVKLKRRSSNRSKLKDQLEWKIGNDDNYLNRSPNDAKQSEKPLYPGEIPSGSNKITSFSSITSEGQITQQHKFYVHSSWLAVQSSYFRSLFFSERNTPRRKEVHVKIPRSEEKAHLMLLEAMYRIHSLDNASVDELLKVLRLSYKYDVKFVLKKCEYGLQAAVVSRATCEKIVRFIRVENTISDVDDLVITLQSFLAKKFSPLDKKWQTKGFEHLNVASLRYLLGSDELVAAKESVIMLYQEQHDNGRCLNQRQGN